MTRRAIAVSMLCAALAVTACGSSQPGGPLTNPTVRGQPAFSVDGGFVNPGQPSDYGVLVINKARHPVTLVSASLIPVSGHLAGRLAVLRVSVKRGELLAGGRGFPIPGVPTKPFRGARLGHGYNTIIFGFAGDRVGGFYMVAGLRITYRYQGHVYAMNAWSASTACVVGDWRLGSWKGGSRNPCTRAGDIDRRATEHLAGVS